MSKRIFILNGHPAEISLNKTLAQAYAAAAKAAGHTVRLTHLDALKFDADYGFGGYSQFKPLEPALEQVMQDLEWSDHVVVFSPLWWGGLPAKLKGLIDRSFLPGLAFDTRGRAGKMPLPMLKGRSARVILTADTPRWFLSLIYRNAILHQLRGQVFKVVGITPARFTFLSGASHPDPARVNQWRRRIETLGAAAG